MKTIRMMSALLLALLAFAPGCKRGPIDRTQSPEANAGGSANEPKNMGNTRAKAVEDGVGPGASPTGYSKDAKPGVEPKGAAGSATR